MLFLPFALGTDDEQVHKYKQPGEHDQCDHGVSILGRGILSHGGGDKEIHAIASRNSKKGSLYPVWLAQAIAGDGEMRRKKRPARRRAAKFRLLKPKGWND